MDRRDVLKSMSAIAALTAIRVPDVWAGTLDSAYKGVKLGLIGRARCVHVRHDAALEE